ncbi:MAG: DUF1232 domain-containing protein [Chloroflexi bacterium]|nr:DUF1232 domain-containing protein [Chloroflexota bacterium]
MDEQHENEVPVKVVLTGEVERAEHFYSRLRRRVGNWLDRHRMGGKRREYLLLLPDLFALLIRLLRDPRVDGSLKKQLIGASAYVIAPLDLVPDFILPIGLTDDTIAIAFVLTRVVAVLGTAGEDILREHWEGQGDILHQIERLTAGANKVLNNWIVRRLGGRFGLVGGKNAKNTE